MPFESLEKLWIYKEAKALYIELHGLLKGIKHEYNFVNQADRSSQSACDNIAEMYGAYYYQVKLASLRVARKESYETINHLKKAKEGKILPVETCDELINRYEKLILGINKYISYITKRIPKK